MKAKYKQPGFWLALSTAVVGLVATVVGMTKEEQDAVLSGIGGIITVLSQFGILAVETKVRTTKILAYLQLAQLQQLGAAQTMASDIRQFIEDA